MHEPTTITVLKAHNLGQTMKISFKIPTNTCHTCVSKKWPKMHEGHLNSLIKKFDNAMRTKENDKQTIVHTTKHKTPPNTDGDFRCSGRVSRSCSTCGTRQLTNGMFLQSVDTIIITVVSISPILYCLYTDVCNADASSIKGKAYTVQTVKYPILLFSVCYRDMSFLLTDGIWPCNEKRG